MHGKASPMLHDGKGIFAGIPSPVSAIRYHSLVGDPATLPAALEVSARLENGMIQGVRACASRRAPPARPHRGGAVSAGRAGAAQGPRRRRRPVSPRVHPHGPREGHAAQLFGHEGRSLGGGPVGRARRACRSLPPVRQHPEPGPYSLARGRIPTAAFERTTTSRSTTRVCRITSFPSRHMRVSSVSPGMTGLANRTCAHSEG